MEVLMHDGVPFDSSDTAVPKRTRGANPLSQIILTEEETVHEEIGNLYEEAEKMGEAPGEPVVLHGAAAHPFTQACFTLKLMLGLYAVLSAVMPFLITFASDQLQTEMILDSLALILAVFIAVLFHQAMQEELLVYVRAYGSREAMGRIGGRIKGAAAAFALSVLIDLIIERVEAYSGEISEVTVWMVAMFSIIFVLLAILLIVRQQVLFRADTMNP